MHSCDRYASQTLPYKPAREAPVRAISAAARPAPSASRLHTARWTAILLTVPRALWQPPPSSLQPIGPVHSPSAPGPKFLHQGLRSTMKTLYRVVRARLV